MYLSSYVQKEAVLWAHREIATAYQPEREISSETTTLAPIFDFQKLIQNTLKK